MEHAQLVKDCLKNRLPAQKALYDLFAPGMLGVCYRYTKSMHDAEDVLQEGFIRVFRYLGQYRQEGPLGAWIRRIMVTTAINYLKTHQQYAAEMFFIDEPLYAVAEEPPEPRLQGRELAALIRQLPAGAQTVFNLYAVEGYSHAEIGALLGIHEGSSRSQYARARTLLQRGIEALERSPQKERHAE